MQRTILMTSKPHTISRRQFLATDGRNRSRLPQSPHISLPTANTSSPGLPHPGPRRQRKQQDHRHSPPPQRHLPQRSRRQHRSPHGQRRQAPRRLRLRLLPTPANRRPRRHQRRPYSGPDQHPLALRPHRRQRMDALRRRHHLGPREHPLPHEHYPEHRRL